MLRKWIDSLGGRRERPQRRCSHTVVGVQSLRLLRFESLENRELLDAASSGTSCLLGQDTAVSETRLERNEIRNDVSALSVLQTTATQGKTIAYTPSISDSIDRLLEEAGQNPQSVSKSFVFNLSSDSDAKLMIYLDFDGNTHTSSYWNNGKKVVTPAYNTSGTTASFSNSELREIYEIWLRVSEDFAPFNVNVTTKEPSSGKLTRSSSSDASYGVRVCIGGSNADWLKEDCGGRSYNDCFSFSAEVPIFCFPKELLYDPKNIADCISHEIGHSLGLEHHGLVKKGKDSYYEGADGWAPIMGTGYYQELSQWSKGEYSGSNNSQDDLKILASALNGYRSDDVGSTISAAKALTFKPEGKLAAGAIERNTDVDFYSFTYDGSKSYMRVGGIVNVTNLDVAVKLYNSSKQLIATFDPADTTYVTFDLSSYKSGKYYISVAGVGKTVSGKTVYSNYASLGSYTIETGPLSNVYDGYEPNASLETAYDLGVLTEPFVNDHMLVGGVQDADWFAFSLPKAASADDTIAITYAFSSSSADLQISLFNSEGIRSRLSHNSNGADSISLKGLKKGATYYIEVVNKANKGGVVPYSLTITPPLPEPLPTPTATVTASTEAFTINIDAVSKATSYVVEYGVNSDFSDAKSKTYSSSGSKTISELLSGTTYYVRVKACANGYSDSQWKTSAVTIPKTKLAAPGVSASAATTSLTLQIDPVANASEYCLEYSLNSDFSGAEKKTYTASGSKTVSNLTPGKIYYYRVKAAAERYADSAWTTGSAETNAVKISKPTVSVDGVGTDTVAVQWTNVKNALSYNVWISTSSTFKTYDEKRVENNAAELGCVFTGLTPQTTYYVRVKAIGDNTSYKNSDWSAAVETATLGVLEPPTFKVYSKTFTSIKLTLGAVENATEYTLDYSTSSKFTSFKTKSYTKAGTPTLSGLTPGATYYFRLKVGAEGFADSEYTTISAKLPLAVPETPSLELTTVGCVAATIKLGEVANASAYQVEYAEDPSFEGAAIVPCESAGECALSNLTPDVTYYLRVKARGDNVVYKDSAYAELSFTTEKATPASGKIETESFLDGQAVLVSLDVTSKRPIVKWTFEWGDGGSTVYETLGYSVNASHFFSDGAHGDYPLTVRLVDDLGYESILENACVFHVGAVNSNAIVEQNAFHVGTDNLLADAALISLLENDELDEL